MNIENNLGANYAADEGQYGWETVGLGFLGSGGPTLNHTVVAGLQTMDFYIGMFGLNPRPTNFSDFNHPQASYLSILYDNGTIPSLSYSYTAGAQYRNNGVLGSLTLGGYDDSLYVPNSVTFPFYFDQSRDLTVGLKSIIGSGGQSLLPNGILAFIDSTVSQMWLPIESCNAFEAAFGLTYDNATQLYFVNDTQHIALQQQAASLTFTLAPTLTNPTGVNIVFPYSAFDLQVSYPIVNGSQRYFPLRRADNDTQYTLGRVFLQETYLTVDYGRSNFSLSQRKWDVNPVKHVVNILSQNDTASAAGNGTGTGAAAATTKSKTSIGPIVGGIVAGVAAIAAIAFGVWFFLRKRKRATEEKKSAELAQNIEASTVEEQIRKDAIMSNEYAPPEETYKHELDTPGDKAPELYGATYFGNVEMSAEERMAELAGHEESTAGRFELEAPHGAMELSPDEREHTHREMLPSQRRQTDGNVPGHVGDYIQEQRRGTAGDVPDRRQRANPNEEERPFSWQRNNGWL